MKKMNRKHIVIILCFSLCMSIFGVVPISVSATEIDATELSIDDVPYFPNDTGSNTEVDTTETTTNQSELEDISVMEEQIDYYNVPLGGYIDIEENVKPYNRENSELVYSGSVPTSYNADINNLRYVSPVKNQGNYNSCWAFALTAAAESNMLKKGYSLYDFSEYQFAYFFYHHIDDPLGNTRGDSTGIYNGSDYLNLGGTNIWSMFAAASWTGLSAESLAPYGTASPTSSLPSSLAFKDQVHMQQCRMIAMSDADDVKKSIMEYGSAVCAVRFENQFFNYSTLALNNDVYTKSNHAICIIGWDDSYNRMNFPSNHRPTANGAWLVKNSWGQSAPYFWVSYEDYSIINQTAFAYSFDMADNYNNIYQYDGAYGSGTATITNDCSIVNKFTITAANIEQLNAVSIALFDDNIQYKIQLYKNSNADNPMSGEPMLITSIVGTTKYAGYYTIDIPQNITVNYGDTVSVVCTLKDLDDDSVDIFVDKTYDNSSGVRFISSTSYGQSYFCDDDNNIDDLKNVASNSACPRIKLFTNTIQYKDNSTVDMFRLYNPNSGEHFYTASIEEKTHLVEVGWNYEGIAWRAPKTGVPVYRLYNPNAGDHHYTTNKEERDHLISVGWKYENIAWYSGGNVPLYRAYNPNANAGVHHYTTNKSEIDYIVSVGWRYEGIAWYGN